jgi:mono/diheme cytochrome c family protein
MNQTITSSALLLVTSLLRHKTKSRIKKGALFMILVALFSGAVIAANPASGTKWQAPASAMATKNPVGTSQTSIAAGQKIYTSNCASCHGPSGNGDGSAAVHLGINPANLSESRGESDGALFWKITNGKKPMPGYGAKLSASDRWNVINYLKTLSGK